MHSAHELDLNEEEKQAKSMELEKGEGEGRRPEAHSQWTPQVHGFSAERASVFTCCLSFSLPTLFMQVLCCFAQTAPSTLQERFHEHFGGSSE